METITMSSREQQRAVVLMRWIGGDVDVATAAALMGCSERTSWRLRASYRREGPAGLVHGNRGRPSPRRLDSATRARILELVAGIYAGANDTHLAELLAERESIAISRPSLRRLLRAAGLPSPRRRRPPRHRSRRERMPQAGLLLQLDGSRHDWLEGRGPTMTLLGAIDDATGEVVAARFREEEDTLGYLWLLRETILRHGVPVAVYRDRAGIFEPTAPRRRAVGEDLGLSQVGRALAELGVSSIAARSPQAKGRIERLWGTFQDRLVMELRLAGVTDLDGANRLLPPFLARHDRRFGVPAADGHPAWRPLPAGLGVDAFCCLKVRRRVAKDHTIEIAGTVLQLPPGRGGRGYAGSDVEVHVRVDGCIVAFDGPRRLATADAPLGPLRLRTVGDVRPAPSNGEPARAILGRPVADHPWRRPGRGVRRQLQRPGEATGLSGSPSS
jgi:transposase